MNIRSARGFSLVELMIVVAIIGILAAIAIPNFTRFQTKSRQAEARANLAAIYTAEKAFNAEWQQFFGDFIEIGYVPEGNFRYEHGFAAPGAVLSPSNYTGAIGASVAAATFGTTGGPTACGTTPAFADIHPSATITINCSVDRAPRAGAPLALANASVLSASTFVAAAHGNIDDDAASDVWQISQDKRIVGPCATSAAFPCLVNGGDLDN